MAGPAAKGRHWIAAFRQAVVSWQHLVILKRELILHDCSRSEAGQKTRDAWAELPESVKEAVLEACTLEGALQ